MKNDLMIKVDSVYKQYKLGTIGYGTLAADIESFWAKIFKKEDPNAKINSNKNKNQLFYALRNINLEVKKGEVVGIIGSNGAGKSTLLKLLCQVTAPTDGTIYLNGRITSMLEVGTGFNPELTGRENIYLNGAILGMKKTEIDKKINDIIEFSEVFDFIDTPVKRYSSGMYVKLAFAVAANLDSEIVIMDEVLAVGDVAFQEKCIAKMKSLAETQNRTILYVSHNMSTIRQLCDRCIVLSKGEKVFDGEVEKAINIYIGNNSKMNNNDLLALEHSTDITGLASMKKMELIGRDSAVFSNFDTLRLSIDWTSFENFKDVRFKFIVRNSNDIAVGMMYSKPISEVKKNGNYHTELEFDLNLFLQDKYFLSIGVIQTYSNGRELHHDHISRAFTFEIEDKQKVERNAAQIKSWGNIKFPDMPIKNEIV